MRILALQFRNLNSLQGEHAIAFEEPPLANAGIFAITGPTGAGKTTILDAITLALYGRAARYERSVPSEVMSRHTGDCFAEVHFESQGKRYGARWELRRARGKAEGALQTPKRIIYDLASKETLVDKMKEADDWVALQTGLDYQRFLRSVLLAQGDFTAFLKASDKERGQLLEKLTGMEIYAELSQLAHEITREKRQQVDDLRGQIAGIHLLSEEEADAQSKTLSQLQSDLRQLEKSVERRRQVEACLERWQAITRKLREHTRAESALQAVLEAAQPWRDRLNRHRQVESHAEAILAWREMRKRQAVLAQDLETLERRSEILSKEATVSKDEALRLEKRQRKGETTLADLGRLMEQVAPLDQECRLRREQLAADEEQLAKQQAALPPIASTLAEKTALLEKLESQAADLQTWLKAHQADALLGASLAQWRRQFDSLTQCETQLIGASNRLEASAARRAELRATGKRLLGEQSTASAKLEHCQAELADLEREEKQLLEERSLADWELSQRELRDRRIRFQKLLNLCQQHRKASTRRETLQQLRADHQRRLEECGEAIDHGKKALAEADDACRLRRQLVQRGQEIRALRSALRKGDPCAVCGSPDHPWQSREAAVAEECELAAFEEALKEQVQKQDQRRQESVRLSTHLHQHDVELAEIQKDTEALESEVASMQASEESPLPCSAVEAVELRLSELESAQIREDQRLAGLRKVHLKLEEARRRRDQIRGTAQKLVQEMAKIQGQEQELTQRYEADLRLQEETTVRFARDLDKLRSVLPDSAHRAQSLAEIGEFLARSEERAQTHAGQVKKADTVGVQRLQAAEAVKSGRAQASQLRQSLTEMRSQCRSQGKGIESLTEKRMALAGERKLVDERRALEALLSKQGEALKAAETRHGEAHREHQTTRALRQQAKKEADNLTAQCAALESKLSEVAASLGFADLPCFLQAYLPSKEARDLASRNQALQDQRLRLETELAQLTRDEAELRQTYRGLAAEAEAEPGEIDLARWKSETEELGEAVNARKRDSWDLELSLKQDREKRRQKATDLEALSMAEKELLRWQQVDTLIGSSDGSRFSRFAQSLTLKRLVELANQHLQQLTDRYRIQCAPERQLEIEVIDLYQANTVRSMQSLSGGEGFLASLALALGLAELAGSRGPIESLFIDEGFGTLDADSLEIAIRALENLQAQNKTIGIISHTELLKERITCQIQVERGRGGTSSLRTVAR